MDEGQLQAKLERAASTYFKNFSTPAFRMQELIGHHKNHWLLSDDFKMAYDQPFWESLKVNQWSSSF